MNKKNNEAKFMSKVLALLKPRKGAVTEQSSVPPKPTTLPKTDLVRLDMETRLKRAGRPLPTEDQWRMILAKTATTRVVAGAGSGKSTTLVLRVIAMTVYGNAPLSCLRVVTFTRNSRADFIKKLRSTAEIWGLHLSQSEASGIVRTFHSLVFAQAKAAGLNVRTLDQLDAGGGIRGNESPFSALSVDPGSALAMMLNKVASELMRSDPSFAQVITALYDHSFLAAGGMHLEDSSFGRIAAVQARDYERTNHMHSFWSEKIAPELMQSSLIEFGVKSFQTGPLSVKGRDINANGPWWANAYVPKMRAWLILGADNRLTRGQRMPDGFSMASALSAKKSCVNVLTSNEQVIWVNSPDDLASLHIRLKWTVQDDSSFPKFGVRLTGEVTSTPLLVAFWQQAQFIQSLGLDVESSAREGVMKTQGVDMLFAQALALFWPALEREVAATGYTLSNRLFMDLADPSLLQKLPDNALLGIQNLLIDEFQDISGIIVKWLKAVQMEIERRGHQTSMMVVGDDWQSIYGWRGASPRFFTNFGRYFGDGISNVDTVYLSENFRSSQLIVDAASVALTTVTEKIHKSCVASGTTASISEPISLLRYSGELNRDTEYVRDFLGKESVFVIARTRSALAWASDVVSDCLTIHGSKGLEADYVLMVDDFSPPSAYPLRCCWYADAGLGDYDAAQFDETMRLAYVAITRAKKGCLWVVRNDLANGVFGHFAGANIDAIRVVEASHV